MINHAEDETMKRKIEIYADGEYIASTNKSNTCKAAKLRIQEAANTYGTLAVAGRGIVDIKGKRITAHFA